ncbi:unnamed protein product [Rotaria sordida]|uniref:Alpha-(1,6)-fucosyltransferase N- and catalytic domain-containing protein n=1 Tax=Rotaria sordida TaxID=392033 RepID=A0A813Z435_9BILA|nr:unnamed protein product [Rotaria sordida]CAF0987536.1 unnamed protein product [Rotaria sordida]CAF1108862.1 unnamed protein product [Rotaria sordida]CAF3679133.1 unnamed protein product [Rotaria sordida]CAF3699860.1 unnamed protein product [Rotaria sordida]
MAPKIVRVPLFLVGAVLIFIIGVRIGSNFCEIKQEPYAIDSSLSTATKLNKNLQSIEKKDFKSFSFAYNTTHLWSMRLADDNYYRIARLLPCRTVKYTNGPNQEIMNSCDQSIINEFSVEATLHAQQWLYEHQHPIDCTNKKFAILHSFAWSGFGSTLHQIVWAFGRALAEDRIAIYETPGNWLHGNCKLGTPDCFFRPISNCSIPSKVHGNQTIRMPANTHHWFEPTHPPIFQNQSFNWYRSQLLFYLIRYNPETLAYVQSTVAKYFNPPSVDSHRPYIAVYVRRSDKVRGREMSQSYSLQQYFDLFDTDARLAKITKVYVNSEDQKVFSEFDQLNKNKQGYYKLLSIDATRDVTFPTLISMPVEQRSKIILEFLTDLYIEVNADLHVGTLTSNWCRLVDEMRFVLEYDDDDDGGRILRLKENSASCTS